MTRNDEPGCEDDPAQHRGTMLRLVARDTVVAERIAGHVRPRRAARLIVEADASNRAALLRAAGPFDEHGDPVDPPVRLWRADGGWALRADRAL